MSLLSNVYQGNAVKEHVGFVVLRASLAARKPRSTQTQLRADNRPRDHEHLKGQKLGLGSLQRVALCRMRGQIS